MTRDDVARQIADELIRIAGATIAERGRFTLAVPGGSVADVVLPLLAAAPIDWRPVDLFLADDRVVDPESPESNERLVRELLIEPLGPAAPTFHPLVTPGVALAEAAARAERDLTTTVGTPPRLDLVLLGVGEDGHVASLF
ncbi:MAG TPA: 6-phosphogluconolactonase, partial [Vicinamibacterales bacterium]